jgi:hypothetical protein
MRPDRSPMLADPGRFPGIDRLAEARAAHAGARRVSSSLCTIALLSGARWEAASSARIA